MARPVKHRAGADPPALPQWVRPQLTQFVDAAPDIPPSGCIGPNAPKLTSDEYDRTSGSIRQQMSRLANHLP